MTDKAYIVANEQQEKEVLGILGANGLKYVIGTYSQFRPLTGFPYVIYESNNSNVLKSGRVPKLNIYLTDVMFDGRKEDQMSDKYVVSQEFMNELEKWKNNLISSKRIYPEDISELYSENVIRHWWQGDGRGTDANNRLIAILCWVNGEDVFKIEKPKKWVVRSKDIDKEGSHFYVNLSKAIAIPDITTYFGLESATRFDTKEEAESWANAHQEVVEVEE